MRHLAFTFLLICISVASGHKTYAIPNPQTDDRCINWADSVFASLTPQERIGQLFMIHGYSNWNEKNMRYFETLLKNYNVGGVIFFQGGPGRQANLRRRISGLTKTPMWYGIDGEWGAAMRLDSLIAFPRQMTLGAIQDNKLLYEFGQALGEQCKALGIHINFAPVLDLNNNPNNPVINSRSLGENYDLVISKGYQISKGLQSKSVMAVGKHFPGHGDTDTDSHYDLPVINHSYQHLIQNEIEPFRILSQRGIWGMMTGHLQVPALDADLPASLSPKVVKGLLCDTLGFEGVTFTDALNMKAVAGKIDQHYVKAFLAGNDVLLFPKGIQEAVKEMREAVSAGIIDQNDIDKRVKKILRYKYMLGANRRERVEIAHTNNVAETKYEALCQTIVKSSVTTLKNSSNVLPISDVAPDKLVVVSMGSHENSNFEQRIKKYGDIFYIKIDKKIGLTAEHRKLLDKANTVVVAVHASIGNVTKNYNVTPDMTRICQEISVSYPTVLAYLGNPYGLNNWDSIIESAQGVMLVYENNNLSQDMLAQAIMGGIATSGRLPISVGSIFAAGDGSDTPKTRLGYSNFLNLGLSKKYLHKADSLVLDAIEVEATPGAQIMVIKDGYVVYDKTYGNHTYKAQRKVVSDDLYDVASVTKVVATLPEFMFLSERGEVKLNDSLGELLPFLKNSNKADIRIDEMLRHQSGLPGYIPFQRFTYDTTTYEDFYSRKKDKEYTIQVDEWFYASNKAKPYYWLYANQKDLLHQTKVADNLFIHESFKDTIVSRLIKTALLEEKSYRYSDLAFYFLKELMEERSGNTLDSLAYSDLFAPLGMNHTVYNPLDNGFTTSDIVPTEDDLLFRKQLLHGYVHDQGAALLGGVAGHAGIFSNCNDLAKLLQMYLNGGEYGGRRYMTTATIDYFTQNIEDGNRRAMGFDKPELDTTKIGPTCWEVSPESFGHTGFTGTMVWADPTYNLIYIFLSNRVYPHAWNKKLLKMDVRTNVQKAIYESISNGTEAVW